MNIFVKHIIRLKNTMVRHLKILSLKIQYGNQIKLEKFHFRDGFHVYIENNGVLKVGRGCFFNVGCSITVRKKVSIGSNCIFGENVKIYDHNHGYRDLTKSVDKQGFVSDEVVISDECWIGSNVVILKGVHIGRHCVIGAGVVVHEDIPENSVVFCKQAIVCKKIL